MGEDSRTTKTTTDLENRVKELPARRLSQDEWAQQFEAWRASKRRLIALAPEPHRAHP